MADALPPLPPMDTPQPVAPKLTAPQTPTVQTAPPQPPAMAAAPAPEPEQPQLPGLVGDSPITGNWTKDVRNARKRRENTPPPDIDPNTKYVLVPVPPMNDEQRGFVDAMHAISEENKKLGLDDNRSRTTAQRILNWAAHEQHDFSQLEHIDKPNGGYTQIGNVLVPSDHPVAQEHTTAIGDTLKNALGTIAQVFTGDSTELFNKAIKPLADTLNPYLAHVGLKMVDDASEFTKQWQQMPHRVMGFADPTQIKSAADAVTAGAQNVSAIASALPMPEGAPVTPAEARAASAQSTASRSATKPSTTMLSENADAGRAVQPMTAEELMKQLEEQGVKIPDEAKQQIIDRANPPPKEKALVRWVEGKGWMPEEGVTTSEKPTEPLKPLVRWDKGKWVPEEGQPPDASTQPRTRVYDDASVVPPEPKSMKQWVDTLRAPEATAIIEKHVRNAGLDAEQARDLHTMILKNAKNPTKQAADLIKKGMGDLYVELLEMPTPTTKP